MNNEEKRALAELEQLASRWPSTLWLFAANGTLHVMKTDASGERPMRRTGAYDPAASIATVKIPCDGGDW